MRHPAIGWQAVRGIGNALRHQDDGIEAGVVWELYARGDLQTLVDVVSAEMAGFNP